MIPYGRQSISEADIEAVVRVLRSDFLTQGPMVPAFEEALAAACAAPHAVAVHNATAALHLACLALGVGPGDRVWTCTNTFLASANCARYCGAEVEFLDIDPATLNLSVPQLAERLEAAARAGRLPKVLVPVHFAGLPCDMAAIARLARAHGVAVIEDASHAVGASYADGSPVGSGGYSDVTVFSFHPVKIMTTAEGGAALARDPAVDQRLRLLRSHGMTREPREMEAPADGPWSYQQVALGFNYRMTELQAALGLSQLERVPQWLEARQAIATRYDSELADLPLLLPPRGPGRSSLHLYSVQVDEARTRVTRRQAFDALRAAGIGVQVHYIPVHTQPYYRQRGRAVALPAAERYYGRCFSLPMYASLSAEDQATVVRRLREVFQ